LLECFRLIITPHIELPRHSATRLTPQAPPWPDAQLKHTPEFRQISLLFHRRPTNTEILMNAISAISQNFFQAQPPPTQ